MVFIKYTVIFLALLVAFIIKNVTLKTNCISDLPIFHTNNGTNEVLVYVHSNSFLKSGYFFYKNDLNELLIRRVDLFGS